MPFSQVTLGRTREQKDRLIRAVSKATADAVKLPEASVRAWIVEPSANDVLVGCETFAEKQKRSST